MFNMERRENDCEEIKLVNIATEVGLNGLEQIIYEPRSKQALNILSLKYYNNINRARYAFLID